ncbi:hypothetical protein LCGC14_1805670 [marine sediment metagenome]|uniref:Uncharacterized protein n=1 Tax=marine sediment metagenome TaxID=412755 RepID=A0A0F9JMZ9_9ZZZZ
MALFDFPVRFSKAVQFIWANVTPGMPRANLLQDNLQPFTIPLTEFVVWDAMHTNLPGTSATDDLALVSNGITDSPTIQTSDLDSAGATTRYASRLCPVPAEYVAGETLIVRFHAGMKTNAADNTATLDLQAYKSDEEEGVSADLCTTAAIDINNTVMIDADFTVTPDDLSPGDLLLLRIAVAVNDAAGGAPVIGIVGSAKLLCDVKG